MDKIINVDDSKPHPELQRLRSKLRDIHRAISDFRPLVDRLPILDSSLDFGGAEGTDDSASWLHHENIPGLKKLRDSVKLDLEGLEKFLDDPTSAHMPPLSTNAPYLVAVWNEVLCAPRPVDSIFKVFPVNGPSDKPVVRGGARPPAAKVDVVANHGRRWIRVNTVKNSRMLAEFREIDSYLTDSDDESCNELEDARPRLAQTEFDNSLLQMGRSLIAAAKANPVEGTEEVPRITLRLTRLNPSLSAGDEGEERDPRIPQTIDLLKEMGIDVELGERRDDELVVLNDSRSILEPSVPPEPTTNINLDLSVLIALISDLAHSPLPTSTKAAEMRFIPPQEYREWKLKKKNNDKKRVASNEAPANAESDETGTEGSEVTHDFSKHSRALTHQLLQEMVKGLLNEIQTRVSSVTSDISKVKFWTTIEARDRCLRIISTIGGPNEKRRAHALFHDVSRLCPDTLSESQAEKMYWKDSRFAFRYIPLFPINLYPNPLDAQTGTTVLNAAHQSRTLPFFRSLKKTCEDILAQETISRSSTEEIVEESSSGDAELQRAVVMKANPKLTAHTVQSLLLGAELGWTTLTANKSSVKAILKEIRNSRSSGRLVGIIGKEEMFSRGEGEKAAIWILDPRSLAEGMRSTQI